MLDRPISHRNDFVVCERTKCEAKSATLCHIGKNSLLPTEEKKPRKQHCS